MMDREEAIELAKSGFWEHLSSKEIASFQLFEEKLCMPFEVFHEAIEKALGRPVWTHEFAMNLDGLKMELMHGTQPPTIQEIMEIVPEEKRIIVNIDTEREK